MTELSGSDGAYSGALKTFAQLKKNQKKEQLNVCFNTVKHAEIPKVQNGKQCWLVCTWGKLCCGTFPTRKGKETVWAENRGQQWWLLCERWLKQLLMHSVLSGYLNGSISYWFSQTVALRSTVEYLPFHRAYLLPIIYFTCENRLYIILLKEMEECNPKLGLNSRGSHCGTWVLDKPP